MSRAPLRLGGLVLGREPCVNGTVSTRAALQAIADGAPVEADVVEVRLDLIGDDPHDLLPLCSRVSKRGQPVLATCRLAAEGGRWAEDDDARAALLLAALEQVDAVDIEWSSRHARTLCEAGAACGRPVVASFHDFAATPSHAMLHALIDEMLALPTTVPKLAAMVHHQADIDRLRSLLAVPPERPRCVIGMGDAARDTRLDFALHGSCFTYAYLDEPVAPGQWPAAQLRAALREAQQREQAQQ